MNWLKSALSLALLLLISNNWTSLVSCQSANGKNDDYSTISYICTRVYAKITIIHCKLKCLKMAIKILN